MSVKRAKQSDNDGKTLKVTSKKSTSANNAANMSIRRFHICLYVYVKLYVDICL
jgi:hypothetical protein